MQLRTLLVLSSLFALSCGEAGKDGASSGASAGASGAAKPAGAGSKTCPEGGSFCLDLPAGFTAEPPKALKVGGTMDIEGPSKQTATLFWGPLEQLPSRQSTMESGNKGKDSVKETFLDGKGWYYQADDENKVRWSQSLVTTATEVVQCSGRQPIDNASADLKALCLSVRPK